MPNRPPLSFREFMPLRNEPEPRCKCGRVLRLKVVTRDSRENDPCGIGRTVSALVCPKCRTEE